MSSPFEVVLERLGDRVATRTGDKAQCLCPAHDDRRPSLSVSRGDDGRALLCCHAGCEPSAIVTAVGLRLRDLFPHANGGNGAAFTGTRWEKVAEYPYRDEHGTLLYEVTRWRKVDGAKTFSVRRLENGSRVKGIGDARRVLYRTDDLVRLDPGEVVLLPEGEKDVDRLRGLGLNATCNPFGATKWRDEYTESLRGLVCVVLPDNDEKGQEHRDIVARSLRGVAERCPVRRNTCRRKRLKE